MPAITFITKDEYNRNPKKWSKRRSKSVNERVEVRIIDDAEEQKMEQEAIQVASSLSSTVSIVQDIEEQLEEVAHEYQKDVYVHYIYGGILGLGDRFSHGRIVKKDVDTVEVSMLNNGVLAIYLKDNVTDGHNIIPWAELFSPPVIINNPYVSGEKVKVISRVECMNPQQLNYLFANGVMNEGASPLKDVVSSCLGTDGSSDSLIRTFAFYILEDWYSMSGDYLGTYHRTDIVPALSETKIVSPTDLLSPHYGSSAFNLAIKLTRYNIPMPVKATESTDSSSYYSSSYYGYGDANDAIGLPNL